MKANDLLLRSKVYLEQNPAYVNNWASLRVFDMGADWMHERLSELRGTEPKTEFVKTHNYNLYGGMKYAICLIAFFASAFLLFRLNPFLTPLAIPVFYLVEVQFLFLFPLLIDNVQNPVQASVGLTWKVGELQAVWTVMMVGFYMLIGLLDIKQPMRKWHIGCLAVLIWYHEIRNRI